MQDFFFKIGIAEIKTFFIAMLPIFEIRGALPIALTRFGLSFWPAFSWSVMGNIVPAIFLVLFLEKVAAYLSRHNYWFNRFFAWLFERTRRAHTRHFEVWGSLALALFVAIPLPLTGAWSGAVAAFVFGISPKNAIASIAAGVLIAGLIVGAITLGMLNLPFI